MLKKQNAQGKVPKVKKNQKTSAVRISAPVAQGSINRMNSASITQGKRGQMIVVAHREYIADVTPVDAFTLSSFAINPAIKATFPWLSRIARNYETYKFRSLKFHYVSSTSSTTIGSIVMGIDYDPNDPAPQSKIEMLNYDGAVRAPLWSSVTYTAGSDQLKGLSDRLYTRFHPVVGSALQTYDRGNLFVSAVGATLLNSVAGEIHVEYVVELHTPQLAEDDADQYCAKVTSAGANLNNPFGTGNITTLYGDEKIKIVTPEATALTFNEPGDYLVDMYVQGTTINATAPGNGASTMGNMAYIASTITGAAANAYYQWRVQCTRPGQKFAPDFSASAAAIALTVSRIVPALYSIIG